MSTTGKYPVSDLEYSIVTTLSNLLQGIETLTKYEADAEQAGDSETAGVFRNILQSYHENATQLHRALGRVVNQS
ncbi:MAG: hypothetical protein AVDCRST_MAG33-1246 [uncultured Thermomicrobiales bacterium]|uniref:Uncharacterized protein n=1 Tax=uncultured Thermomicrobiales bacterium TaxID=1645740 RepID=A0A6J4UN90_9BACT|nr:MAG: hypothetical protein AVDCRST_MAG33-1246 [uncultured Thermomicrobiales bacterium]